MTSSRSASFHVLVVGEDLAGLAYAALAARAGYRVGVLGQGAPQSTYMLQGHVLPREPERIVGLETSPVINAVFRDLSMGMEMRNLPRLADPILQYVRQDSRLDVCRDFERWMAELERELPDDGRSLRHFESWAAETTRLSDELVTGDEVLPTLGLRGRARYDKFVGDRSALVAGVPPEGVAPLDTVRDGGATRGLVRGAISHLTTLRAEPMSALATARLWTQLKSGLTSVPGGTGALRELFIAKIKEQCGDYRASAHVEAVRFRRGRAAEVILTERGERLGCELLVSGMAPRAFYSLLGRPMNQDRFQRSIANREPVAWRLTVNLAMDARAIPVGMDTEVLLVASGTGALDSDDCLWISRPGAHLSIGRAVDRGQPGPGVLCVTALMPARGIAPRPEAVRTLVDSIVDRVRGLVPWLDDHLELVDCPALRVDPSTGLDSLDSSALVPIYDRPIERTLGLGGYDGRTGWKNVLLCGRGRFGGLGFEGDCMAALQTLELTRQRLSIRGSAR